MSAVISEKGDVLQPAKKKRRAVQIDESLCVFCNNTNVNYLEDSFKFYTAKVCGHQICQVCLRSDALQKKETECPICGSLIKKTQLSDKSKEELEYERSCEIRIEIRFKEFNLQRQDFNSTPEYTTYDELTETIIYNLIKRIDIEWTEKERENNRKKYREIIARNLSRHAEQIRLISDQLRNDALKDIQKLRDVELAEIDAITEKERDIKESNLVKLGELGETTKEKLKREDETKRKREKLREYEGDYSTSGNGSALTPGQLFWRQAQMSLPRKVDKSFKKEEFTRDSVSYPGGFDPQVVETKLQQILLASLHI